MHLAAIIFGAWIVADFISGLAHWFEDKILTQPSKIKFINSIQADNDLHHKYPTAMCKSSVWQNINTSAVIAWPLALLLFLLHAPMLFWLAFAFTGIGNLIHRWAHQQKFPSIIHVFQCAGIFCSFEEHLLHHYDETGILSKDKTYRRYCVMTNYLNPILDRIGFFGMLSRCFIYSR